MNAVLAFAALVALAGPIAAQASDVRREAEVARRGADVMPFNLAATTHIFAKTEYGGVQRVVVKKAGDAEQTRLVRSHLQVLRDRFMHGDFSGPAHIHGDAMPGLAELEAAKRGQILIVYKDVAGGAELAYRTADPELVRALHRWFDAQLSDHGGDATEAHHHGGAAKP